MASVKDLGSILLANTFLDEPKNRKKKKAKKSKKETLIKPKSKKETLIKPKSKKETLIKPKSKKETLIKPKSKKETLIKPKSKAKDQQSPKDFMDICDSNLFAKWLKNRRKEKTQRKKKPDVTLNEAFPLTQNKNLQQSRLQGPGRHEALQPITSSIQKERKQKKRVVFNLSPVLLEPEPVQHPPVTKYVVRPQHPSAVKKPSFNAVFAADGRHGKPAVEENGSQSTSDDINSQDLFITQKTFSVPYIDLCSSTSAEEALEPHGCTETRPGTQSNTEPSAKEHVSPRPQSYAESKQWKRSCPENQASMASSAKELSSPEPRCYTASYPEPQTHTASARKRSSSEPQSYTPSYPEPQASTASSPWKQPSPEPRCYTASYPEPQSYPASSSARKRFCPVPQCHTALFPEPQSLPKKPSCPSYPSSPPRKPSHCYKLDVFTQTENFFTSPLLAFSLRFRQRSPCTEEPMDLSLPKRSRLHQDEAVSKALGDQRYTEPNVTDLTSGDDSDSHSKSKADLSHLKTVQMRLNESFFFKLKGEGDSPKPVSPLMKFTGSAEKKKP